MGEWFSPTHGMSDDQKAVLEKMGPAMRGGLGATMEAFKKLSPAEQDAYMTIDEGPEQTALRRHQWAKAAHETASAVGKAGLVFLPGALEAAPVATLAGMATGAVGATAGKAIASAAGATPDQSDVAGDIGGVLGGYGGSKFGEWISPKVYEFFGARLSPSVANARPRGALLQPAHDNTQAEVVDYARQKGIDLTPFQATRAPVAGGAEAVGERSLVGGGKLIEARDAEAQKFGANVIDLARRVDPQNLGRSDELAGEAIHRSVTAGEARAHAAASAAFRALPEDLLNAPVDVGDINVKYVDRLAEAENALANRNPGIAAQIRDAYEQGAGLGTKESGGTKKPILTFADAQKVRSDAIKDGPALIRAGAPTEIQGIYGGLAKDLDAAMEKTATDLGHEGEWRAANAGWKAYLDKYSDPSSPLYRILGERDPKRILTSILERGSAADIQLLKQENLTSALQALRSQTLLDIATRNFRVNPEGLGGYSHAFLTELFGPTLTKELYVNGALARGMNWVFNPSRTSNVATAQEQLTNPSRMWPMPIAARMSRPRPAESFTRPTPKLTPAERAPILLTPSGVYDLARRVLGGGGQ